MATITLDWDTLPSGVPRLHFRWGEDKHLWICNFRRYSWSWTTNPNGQEGYSLGVVYANSVPIIQMATSHELVIRDALVVTWERALSHQDFHFRKHFDNHSTQLLLTLLYQEALEFLRWAEENKETSQLARDCRQYARIDREEFYSLSDCRVDVTGVVPQEVRDQLLAKLDPTQVTFYEEA